MNRRLFLFVVMTALFAAVFTSCIEDEGEKVPTYTVRFDSKGGTPTPQEQTVKEGGKIEKPADPTRENYSFTGWAKADNATSALWNFATETVTGNMTLFAGWVINTYLVTFDSDGGSTVPTQDVTHGSTATKPEDPTRDGYEFDGWFNGNTEWNFATAITAPVTLKAKWTALYAVTFDSDGGNEVSSQSVAHGSVAFRPTDPTRYGYEFDGWFNGNTEWDFATAITAPVTLKAKWTALHTVTFDSDGGNDVSAQIIRNGNTVTKPTDPAKEFRPTSGLYLGTINLNVFPSHYAFIEWRKEGESTAFDFNTPVTAPITLKAVWNIPSVSLTPITSVLSNDIDAAVIYVNANSYSGEEYTLLLGADVTVATQTLNAANAKLTIIGIGAEKTITSSKNQLFIIDGNNTTNLTLGQNITLKRDGFHIIRITDSDWLVRVRRGSLTMRNGSKITEDVALFVSGLNAVFKMESGEISGGGNYSVHVGAGATFEMSGGSITDDTNIYYDGIFRLSGNARIGTLILNANNATTRSSVNIVGNYSGTVTRLHLSGYGSTATLWTNVPVIVNGTTGVISMFNNGLGEFRQSSYSSGTPISATHVLNASGLLVLKEN